MPFITSKEQLAFRLNNQLIAINLQWGDQSTALLPSPEQTLRQLLAAPLTLTARVVSGESDKQVLSSEEAKVRFNYEKNLRSFEFAPYTFLEPQNFIIPKITVTADDAEAQAEQQKLAQLLTNLSEAGESIETLNASSVRLGRLYNRLVAYTSHCDSI